MPIIGGSVPGLTPGLPLARKDQARAGLSIVDGPDEPRDANMPSVPAM